MHTSITAVALMVAVSMLAACQTAATAQPVQTPTGRPPYRIGAMTIPSGAVSLAGTVTVPEGPGPFPAVIVARVAGAVEQDEALADGLTRRGIVVLRADARSVDDIIAMATQVKNIPSVDPARIGVVGHGTDASLAAQAATQSSSIRFVAALSAQRSAQTLLSQVTVPLYSANGDPTRADVIAALAIWVLARK